MANPPPKLEDLMDFPSVFTFRVMGEATDTLPDRCSAALTGALERPPEHVELRESSAGRYLAVRLGARVDTPDQIYAVYAALRAVEGVRLVL